jgi:hypothetical protein
VAPINADVLKQLKDKHPTGAPHPFGNLRGQAPGSLPTLEDVISAAKDVKKDTSGGVSGWNPHLLAIAMRKDDFAKFLHLLTCQIAQGTAPGNQILCASRLTPLLKPDGKVRPIAVGELFYRIAMKTILRHFHHPRALLPFQFGVCTPGGVEPIVHIVQQMHDGVLEENPTQLVALDFSNAFNATPRRLIAKGVATHCPSMFRAAKWAYNDVSPLVICQQGRMHLLDSSEGVKQGDPLSGFLFSMAIRDSLQDFLDAMPDDTRLVAYMDDIYLLGTAPDLLERSIAWFREHPDVLQLNPSKCSTLSLAQLRQHGMPMLGTFIGSKEARTQFLQSKIDEQAALVAKLSDLPNQHALLLLRLSIQQNLRHLMRTLDSSGLEDLWAELDTLLHAALRRIRNSPRFMDSDATLFSLPPSFGGLGVPRFADCIPHARAAMTDTAIHTIDSAFGSAEDPGPTPPKQGVRLTKMYAKQQEAFLSTSSPSDCITLADNSSSLGRRWLTTIPYFPALRLSDPEVSAALHIRTLCPGQSPNCRHCALPNIPGHDDLCSARPNWRLARHEVVKKSLMRHLSSIPQVAITPEPPVPDSNMRTDFRITGVASPLGVSSELDLTIVAPTSAQALASAPLSITSFHGAQQQLQKHLQLIANEKNTKYSGKTATPFLPLVISSGGTMGQDAKRAFELWKQVSPSPFPFLKTHISLLLLRARAKFFSF